jgi:hypothetical protein
MMIKGYFKMESRLKALNDGVIKIKSLEMKDHRGARA